METFIHHIRIKTTTTQEIFTLFTRLKPLLSSENGIPTAATLIPLNRNYENRAMEIKTEINSSIINKISIFFENLNIVLSNTKDLLLHTVSLKIPLIKDDLQVFEKMVFDYKQSFIRNLACLLPLVREGKCIEYKIQKIVQDANTTVFSMNNLKKWIEFKSNEIDCFNSIFEVFKKIKSAFNPAVLETMMNNREFHHLVILEYTVPKTSDPFLEHLHKHLVNVKDSTQNNDYWFTMWKNPWYSNQSFREPMWQSIMKFLEFHENNQNLDSTAFAVTHNPTRDCTGNGIIISLYNSSREWSLFQPLSKPRNLRIGCSHDDPKKIKLEWLEPEHGSKHITFYSVVCVTYKEATTKNCILDLKTVKKEETISLAFQQNMHYKFTVYANCDAGKGPNEIFEQYVTDYPECSTNCSNKHKTIPDANLKEILFTAQRFSSPSQLQYQTSLRTKSENKQLDWQKSKTEHTTDINENQNHMETFSKVKPLNVGVDNQVTTQKQQISIQFKSISTDQAIKMLKATEIKDGSIPAKYHPHIHTTYANKVHRIYKCDIGEIHHETDKNHKVFMLVGATGVGKTTLINAMFNFISGIKWDSSIRFQLIEENNINREAVSQTESITAYTFHGTILPHCLTIIDTPGFGDTEGIEGDAVITEQIKEFLALYHHHGIKHINGIGFVLCNSDTRLTQTQEYIINSILSIFGRNTKISIFLMITHCDSKSPPVVTAIKKAQVPFINYYKFNNSALYSNNRVSITDDSLDDNFDEVYWEMGSSSLKDFFNKFQITKAIDILHSCQVLEQRFNYEAIVYGIKEQIEIAFVKEIQCHVENQAVAHHSKYVLSGNEKSFSFQAKTLQRLRINKTDEKIATCCDICKIVCHNPCLCDEKSCQMIYYVSTEGKFKCTVCECVGENHSKGPFVFKSTETAVTYTSEGMKDKQHSQIKTKHNSNKSKTQQPKYQLNELYEIRVSVVTQIIRLQQELDQFHEMAFRRSKYSYIDDLIEHEELLKNGNYQQRIDFYNLIKKAVQQVALSNRKTKDVVTTIIINISKEHKSHII